MFLRIFVLTVTTLFLWNNSRAGTYEFSLGASYHKSTYSGGSFSSVRTLGGNVGYYFFNQSSLELSYQEMTNRDEFVGVQSSSYYDRILSLNWVQNFASRQSMFQPYLKGGVGQLNRDAKIVDALNRTQRAETNTVTAVGGAGFRLYLTKDFAIRCEINSYLSGARIKTWNQNYAWTIGVSYLY